MCIVYTKDLETCKKTWDICSQLFEHTGKIPCVKSRYYFTYFT